MNELFPEMKARSALEALDCMIDPTGTLGDNLDSASASQRPLRAQAQRVHTVTSIVGLPC